MPRRSADYQPTDGFNHAEHHLLGRGVHPGGLAPAVPVEPFHGYRYGRPVEVDVLWGHGNSLEWADVPPAAVAQLHRAAGPRLGAPGVRAALPANSRTAAHGGPRRQLRAGDRRGRGRGRRPEHIPGSGSDPRKR
jgi:cytochrome c oxidase subunit 1